MYRKYPNLVYIFIHLASPMSNPEFLIYRSALALDSLRSSSVLRDRTILDNHRPFVRIAHALHDDLIIAVLGHGTNGLE